MNPLSIFLCCPSFTFRDCFFCKPLHLTFFFSFFFLTEKYKSENTALWLVARQSLSITIISIQKEKNYRVIFFFYFPVADVLYGICLQNSSGLPLWCYLNEWQVGMMCHLTVCLSTFGFPSFCIFLSFFIFFNFFFPNSAGCIPKLYKHNIIFQSPSRDVCTSPSPWSIPLLVQ